MNEDLKKLARRRAGAKLGVLIHATVYLLVNAGLVAIQHRVSPQFAWNLFPLAGWGLGLAIHAAAVHLTGAGSSLRERLEQSELRRLEAQRGSPGAVR